MNLQTRFRSVIMICLLASGCAMHARPGVRASADAPISERSVRAHMEFLAGDALNGRGSGTRDEWIAASYAASHMRRLGLEPVGGGDFVHTVDIERTELTSAPVLTIGNRRFTHGKEIVVQSLGAPRVSGRLQKWTPGAAVQPGAAVLLPDPAPADVSALSRAIVLSPQTPLVKGRWQMLGARPPRMARRYAGVTGQSGSTVYLDPHAYAAIVAGAADGETVSIEADSKQGPRGQTWNAVGQLRGTDGAKARVILLSAHLDHLGNSAGRAGASGDTIYNGADDDASGSIAVLELMEVLARGPRPKRTMVFALFGSEEVGGDGSRFFAEKPSVPLDTIVANLQFEMIARADDKVPPHTLWLTGFERSTLGPELARRGAKLVQDPHLEQNFFERSDNIQFARRGVIAHTVSSYGLHKAYHTPGDDIQQIDFAHMTDAIRSMVEPIRWLANADFVPAWLPGKKP